MKPTVIKNEVCDIHYTYGEYDFTVKVLYNYNYLPARLDCAWEDSYPDEEDFEFEIQSIEWDGLGQSVGLCEPPTNQLFMEVKQRLIDAHKDYIQQKLLDIYYTGLDY